MQTIDGSNRYGMVLAHLTEYYGAGQPIDLREPMHTVKSRDREALSAAHNEAEIRACAQVSATDNNETI